MASLARGVADGSDGTWMLKTDADGRKSLSFLRDDKGESVLGLELDGRSIVAVINDKEDSTSYRIFTVKSEVVEEGKPPVVTSLRTTFAKGLPPEFISLYAVDPQQSALLSPDRHITVILSVGSGTRQATKFNDMVVRPLLQSLGLLSSTSFFTTTSADSITDYTRNTLLPACASKTKQIIILLSGDGGLIDLLNVLASSPLTDTFTKPMIYALPLGTGNALSNSYLYNSDATHGLSTLLRGKPRPLPSFRATFSPSARLVTNEGRDRVNLPQHSGRSTLFGAVVCSWGLHATLVADSDTAEYRKHGAVRFQLVAEQLLFPKDGDHHAYLGQVRIKDPYAGEWEEVETKEHSYVLSTMVSHLEKTFNISPDSQTLDGMMRLVRIDKMGGKELMGVMQGAYNDGAHVETESVHYREVDGVRIEVAESDERWRRICVDGKIIALEEGGWVQIEKEAESVIDLGCLK